MIFAEKLIKLRKERGMSQQKLADKAGISQTAIYYMEKGERNPKLETIIKIAKAFDIYLPLLLDGCENRYEIAYALDDPSISESLKALDKARDITKRVHPHNYLVEKNRGATIEEKNSLKTDTLLRNYQQLNDSGQDKAIEQVEMLTKIPEYRKDTDTGE